MVLLGHLDYSRASSCSPWSDLRTTCHIFSGLMVGTVREGENHGLPQLLGGLAGAGQYDGAEQSLAWLDSSVVCPGLMEPSGTVRLMLESGRTIRPPWLVTEDHLVNRVSVRRGCGVED